jgi:hypothetical protein
VHLLRRLQGSLQVWRYPFRMGKEKVIQQKPEMEGWRNGSLHEQSDMNIRMKSYIETYK